MAGKEIRKKREEDRSKREDAGYSLLLDLADALKRHEEDMPQLPEMLNGLAEVCQLLAKEADESRKGDERMRPEEQLKSMMKEQEEKSERLVTLQSTLDEKGKQIIAMEKDRERLVTLQSTLDKKGEQIIAMEKERERYREENQTLKNERDEIKEKCKEKLKDKKEKILSFENELQNKERELAHEKKQRGKEQQLAQQRILSFENKLEIKEREIADEKKERGKEQQLAQQRISSSESELKKKKSEQEDAKREQEKQEKLLQRKIKDLDIANQKIQNHEATIKRKSTMMQRLTGSSKDPREKSRKVDTEKLTRLEIRIENLESDLTISKAEKEHVEWQMSDELKEKDEIQRKFESDFQVKEGELKKILDLKDEAIRKLEIDLQVKTEEFLNELKEKNLEIAQLESELRVVKDDHENETIQLEDEMNAKANKMIAKLETELSKNESDHEKVKEQLLRNGDEAQQRIAQLQTELREKGSDFEKEKEQLIRKGDEAQQRMTAHEEHCKNDSPSDSETIHSGCLERIAQLQTEHSEKGSDFEKEKQQLTRKGDKAQQRISELESKFTVMKEDHKNEKIKLKYDMKEKLIDELESKLKDKKDDDHEKEKLQLQRVIEEKGKLIAELESKCTVTKEDYEKEKLQFQKEKQESGRLCDRLIQERDSLKEKVEYYATRLASLSEKRVKQDQRKVEDTLGLNRQSELEKDINDFFDNERIDACEVIQEKNGSEEQCDVLIYYPRLACMILETAYEQTVDARTAVVDLFEKMSEWMIVQAADKGRLFARKIKDGGSWPIHVDVLLEKKEREHPVDVDGLMLSLKETAHHANLDNFVQDVENIVLRKWYEWVKVDRSCRFMPSQNVLLGLREYTQACIRLTWRMVTQVPPMSLEYRSTILDLDKCHKRMGYHCSQEMYTTIQGSDEEIACYLWPGFFDGEERLIRQGEVLCKVKKQS